MLLEEGSVSFLALLITLTNVLAFLLIVFLILGKSKANRGNILLGLIILQYTLWVFPDFLHLLGLLDNFPHLVRIYVFGSLLLGPMTYFYVRTCTEEDFKVTPKMAWHFIPAGIDFIYQLPFYTLNGADKLEYFYNFFLGGSFQQPPWLTLGKVLQMLIYVFISARIVQKYRNYLKNTASAMDTTFHRWLFFFCIALTIPLNAALIYNFFSFSYSFHFMIICLFLTILTAFSLLVIKPSLFSPFPYQIKTDEAKTAQKKKYEKSKLQATQKDKYLEKINAYMTTYQSHLEPELTLHQLAEKVGIPVHYFSQVINEKLGMNFIDFINGYRVNAVKEKLTNKAFDHYSIIAIAYQSGFNAKSTFYAVFKKHAGMTPSAYRKQAK